MDKKTRIIIIVGSIITFVIVPIVTALIISQNQQPVDDDRAVVENPQQLPERSNDDLAKAINDQSQELKSEDGNYTFVILNVKQPEKGWYVVTIRAADDTSENPNTALVVLQDTGHLQLLLGPGTSFSQELTQSLGIPDTVARELNP